MTKIIVTHFNPDLDAFLAVWLVRKFWPTWDEAEIKMVPVGQRYEGEEKDPSAKPLLEDEDGVSSISGDDVVHVDTGWGMFDHHDRNDFVCAASLFWESVKERGLDDDLSKEERSAIEKLISYALAWDHGLFYESKEKYEAFQIYNHFDLLPKIARGRDEILDLGLRLLTSQFLVLKTEACAEREFLERKMVIKSPLGKVLAIESDYSGIDAVAYRNGFDLVIQVMPKSRERAFSARPSSRVDLTVVYNKLKEIEPSADWFLHASKKLLLCGSAKAGKKRLSELSLEQLIKVLKESKVPKVKKSF